MTMLSVPACDTTCIVSVPAAAKVRPSHMKGKAVSQTVRERSSRLLRCRVTTLSHPFTEVCCTVYSTGLEKVLPLKV